MTFIFKPSVLSFWPPLPTLTRWKGERPRFSLQIKETEGMDVHDVLYVCQWPGVWRWESKRKWPDLAWPPFSSVFWWRPQSVCKLVDKICVCATSIPLGIQQLESKRKLMQQICFFQNTLDRPISFHLFLGLWWHSLSNTPENGRFYDLNFNLHLHFLN